MVSGVKRRPCLNRRKCLKRDRSRLIPFGLTFRVRANVNNRRDRSDHRPTFRESGRDGLIGACVCKNRAGGTDNGNMGIGGKARCRTICPKYRRNDHVVFLIGPCQPAGDAKLRTAERCKPCSGLIGEFRQVLTMRTPIKARVKFDIVRFVFVLAAAVNEARRRRVFGIKHATFIDRHPLSRKAGANCLQLGHGLEHGCKMLLRHIGDDRAFVRLPADKAAGTELAQGLAHRGSGNLKTIGQRNFVEPFPRVHGTGNYQIGN